MRDYQRYLTPVSKPFNPLLLARETEELVTKEGKEVLERKYVGIYSAPVYGGIATAYAAGCCLRCIYCWSNWTRDFPEKYGQFYSPKEIAQKLFQAAREGITYPGWSKFRYLKVNKLRLSGCEPTIGKEHLLSILRYVKDSEFPLFILETNGILLGNDLNYVKQLVEFREKLYVRVSFKAATAEGFTKRTGAEGEFYELPFQALRFLLKEGIDARAAAMTDPHIMPEKERKLLIEKLAEIDQRIAKRPEYLEEEKINGYETTIKRLKAFNDLKFAQELEDEITKKY